MWWPSPVSWCWTMIEKSGTGAFLFVSAWKGQRNCVNTFVYFCLRPCCCIIHAKGANFATDLLLFESKRIIILLHLALPMIGSLVHLTRELLIGFYVTDLSYIMHLLYTISIGLREYSNKLVHGVKFSLRFGKIYVWFRWRIKWGINQTYNIGSSFNRWCVSRGLDEDLNGHGILSASVASSESAKRKWREHWTESKDALKASQIRANFYSFFLVVIESFAFRPD